MTSILAGADVHTLKRLTLQKKIKRLERVYSLKRSDLHRLT